MQNSVTRPIIALAFLVALGAAVLANPGGPAPWLAWAYWAPLIWLSNRLSTGQQVGLWGIWATAWWALTVWWLAPALVAFSEGSWLLAGTGLLLLALCQALPYVLFAAWRGWLASAPWADTRWQAATWLVIPTLCLTLVPQLLPGHMVHTQYQHPELIQLVAVAGVPLLLLVMIGVNWLWAEMAGAPEGTKRQTLATSLLLMMIALPLYGSWQIRQLEQSSGSRLTVAMLQPELSRESGIEPLLAQTDALLREHPEVELVLWPEFPAYFSFVENERDRQRLQALIARYQVPFIVNSGYVFPQQTPAVAGERPYFNAAHWVSADGELMGSYHKRMLVPFFEYLPGEAERPWLRQLLPEALRYLPGESAQPMVLSEAVVVAPLICYEAIFPALLRPLAAQGANVIVNLSNDGWFGDSDGSRLHMALAWFRTVEQRMPWLRVTNSGVSIAVSATGVAVPESEMALQTTDSRVVSLPLYAGPRPDARLAQGFIGLLLVLAMLMTGYRLCYPLIGRQSTR